MAAGKRNENETFNTYRYRLSVQERKEKHRNKGRVIWASSHLGTYVKLKHGSIGT